ncbi:unnamed protein product [Adineta steineri]|nr:unnamed protein product [Adineta steineri]CAF1455770.1 unnamed protein product [Adineta steineri]
MFGEQSSQTDTLMEISSMFSDIETSHEHCASFEDLMNVRDQISSVISSTSTQNEELTDSINEYQEGSLNSLSSPSITIDTITTEISIKNNLKKIKTDLLKNYKKTLVVTGLRDDINQTDLYNYFLGSVQVIIKQCQTSPFKYCSILAVTDIPENVSEDDLRHLFPNFRISNYCPARTVRRKSAATKILWG